VVLEIPKLSQGSVARATEPMFTLVPLGGDLIAEVKIDAIDIGYVKLGDVVHVKLDAYPFQRHGGLPGVIQTISEDAFRREADPNAGMEAFYTSRIQLGATRLKKMPEQSRLLPGMTVSAEIAVGKRSVMSYLIWPLIRALDESIREP
jgi:hemolysin D